MKTCFRLATALSFLIFCGSAFGYDKPSPNTPGKYTNWGGQIEKLEIVAPFNLADYQRIVVEPFDTSQAPLPKEGAKTYPPVKAVLGHVTAPFLAGLSGPLAKVPASLGEPGQNPGPGTLVVRGQVLRMDPGAHAPRYSPDGAGSARVLIAGEVVDGGTGKTLLHFRQERRSGSSRDMVVSSGGRAGAANVGFHPVSRRAPLDVVGDYEKTMSFEVQQIGGDLADVLQSF
jgi:hypothetical protein